MAVVVALFPQKDLVGSPRQNATPRRINCQLHSDLDLDLEFKWLKIIMFWFSEESVWAKEPMRNG